MLGCSAVNTQRYEVLRALQSTLMQGRPAFLVTVLETWGASPRPAGSILAFDPLENKVHGSVSGGCVEEDLLSALKQAESLENTSEYPKVSRYGIDASGYSLPCGAEISLLIEHMSPLTDDGITENVASSTFGAQQQAGLAHIDCLIRKLDASEHIYRLVDLESGAVSVVESVGHAHNGAYEVRQERDRVYLRYAAPDKLLLIGVSDVARYLTPLAEQIGYDVCVCEPRGRFLERQTGFENIKMITGVLPDDLVYRDFSGTNSAVIALAHDPRVDDLALFAALQSKAHFIGALGSERNAQVRRGRLESLGLSKQNIERLNAPVGMNIGSHTPSEIAISIAAQLIQFKMTKVHDFSTVDAESVSLSRETSRLE